MSAEPNRSTPTVAADVSPRSLFSGAAVNVVWAKPPNGSLADSHRQSPYNVAIVGDNVNFV